jgi:hypothetical protein
MNLVFGLFVTFASFCSNPLCLLLSEWSGARIGLRCRHLTPGAIADNFKAHANQELMIVREFDLPLELLFKA